MFYLKWQTRLQDDKDLLNKAELSRLSVLNNPKQDCCAEVVSDMPYRQDAVSVSF